MRTLIQGGWVVWLRRSRPELIPNRHVVFEDDRLIHVGRDFGGNVDRTMDGRGKLRSPGLINCHLHAAVNARSRYSLVIIRGDGDHSFR